MLFATVRQRKIHVKRPETVIRNGKNVDELVLEMDDEWVNMDSITGVFTLKYQVAVEKEEEKEDGNKETVTVMEDREVAKEVFVKVGEPVLVPWECLVETGLLSFSITGYVGGEQVMTTMMPDSFWTVVQNGPMDGDESIEPTPSLYDQIMAAAGRANTAAAAAEKTEAELRQAKENGDFDGVSPTVKVDGVVTGAAGSDANVENVGTEQDVKLRFTIPRGFRGDNGRSIERLSLDARNNLIAHYSDKTTQIIGIPTYMNYPYVKGVLYNQGTLGVEYALEEGNIYTDEIPIPVVTEADRQKWDSKVDVAFDNILVYPEHGMAWMFYSNGERQLLQLLPDPAEASEGAFLRTTSDGAMAWANLTDVSKEGA